jgi:NTE family protein
VVLRSGDLAQAVRASIAIPLAFAPELRDGRFLADGGLSANIPVAVARSEGAERVVVSDATEHPAASTGYSPINVADRLIEFLFQQPAESLPAGDGASRRGGLYQSPGPDRPTADEWSRDRG